MAEATIRYKIVTCPNCGNKVTIQRVSIKCRKCGYIFVDYLERMNTNKIEERTTTRRTGEGVEHIDG